MALYSYYFNSRLVDGVHDRNYSAEDFCEYLRGIISDGILANPSNNMQVTANNGLDILVKAGEGWISGHKILLDADYPLTINAADTALNRIDRVVFALNKTDRLMQIYIKTGELATNPVAPALENSESLIELSLATIRVDKNTTAITQALITDTRYSADCGIVHSLIEQLDTSTAFAQYDNAFNTWFNSLKEDLVSNTIFIEKKSVYTTSVANTTTIAIPTELLYGDALDVLHVYVNGFRLVEGVQYTKTDTTITFTPAISAIGTKIEITNWKTMGSDNVQSAIETITNLESKMANIQKYRYDCTGSKDNETISYLIGNFYDGTGKFTGVSSQAQLKLSVYGTININDATNIISTTNCKGFIAAEKTSNRKVILDLSNADIVCTLTTNKNVNAIIDVISSNFEVLNPKINAVVTDNALSIIRTSGDVKGGYITVTNNGANAIIGIECTSTNATQRISDTQYSISATNTESAANNLVGFACRETDTDNQKEVEFVNCTARMSASANTYYSLRGFKGYGIFENCFAYCYNTSQEEYALTYGFDGGGRYTDCSAIVTGNRITRGFSGIGKYTACKSHAASNTTQSAACVGFYINGEATNCEGIGRNAGNGSGYGFLFGTSDNKVLKLVNCKGYGYCGTGQSSNADIFAHGISVSSNAENSLVCIACECPSNPRQYLVQKGSILAQGSTSGANASFVGNIVYQAIVKHSGTNATETGTIIA